MKRYAVALWYPLEKQLFVSLHNGIDEKTALHSAIVESGLPCNIPPISQVREVETQTIRDLFAISATENDIIDIIQNKRNVGIELDRLSARYYFADLMLNKRI